MNSPQLIAEIAELAAAGSDGNTRVVDCRFALQDSTAGRTAYKQGHIPGAVFMDLNEDLSGPLAARGGRHPLPAPEQFAARLAAVGIGLDTPVIAYDDNRMAGAARFWWICQALGYRQVRLLAGGWSAWLAGGYPVSTVEPGWPAVPVPKLEGYSGLVDREGALALQAQGALLVDAREPRRYAGLEEPVDPIAGHIPGALNLPWQTVTDTAGYPLSPDQQRARWAQLDPQFKATVVCYCGSGVTACVNILSRVLAGLPAGILYNGSWSDWCAWLKSQQST